MKPNLRKVLMLLALLTLCVALCLSFASCKKDKDEHTHAWDEGTVTKEATCTAEGVKTFTCSCGDTKTEPVAKKEHTYTMVKTEPTCTTAGSKLYTCTCGNSYSDPIPATGHNYKTTEYAATCSAYGYTHSVCQNDGCDAEYKKLTTILDHNYVLDTAHSQAATCAQDGSNVYTCQNEGCQYSYSETVKATAHKYVLVADSVQTVTCLVHGQATYECEGCDSSYTVVTQAARGRHDTTGATWTAGEPEHLDGCDYKVVETTKCVDCGATVTREKTIQKHSHAVEVTEPTCTTAGSLVYTCACGDTYNKDYAINPNAHVWGEPVEGVYTCTEGCGATKKELVVENGEVSKDSVTADTELKLDNNTTMQMDQTLLEQLPENVQLGAEVVPLPDDISDDVKERIGDNPVYDFTLKDGDNHIDFNGGKMTVRVPYTLDEGEDPNNIVVWYIADNGEVEAIPATYVNGEAVFEVTHFSKYTVIRMTPEELCGKLGCEEYTITYPVTCTSDGYTVVVCKRCHKTTTTDTVTTDGHSYVKNTVPATCTNGGYDSQVCEKCGDSYKENYVNAKGHSYVDTEVKATCSTKGYTLHTCSVCQSAYKDSYTDATGHNFNEGTCTRCGAIDNGYVEAKDNFYFTLIESLLGLDNLYVNLSDLTITVNGYNVVGGTETLENAAEIKIDLLHFMLTVDENGNPMGKGEGRLTGTSDSENFFGEFNNISAEVIVVLKDNGLYVFIDADTDGQEYEMEIFFDISNTPAQDSFDQLAQILPALEALYSEGLDDIIAGIKELRGNPINGIIAAIMEYVFVKEETATGYVFTLNYDRLPEIYDVVMNKNLAEIFDIVFGEGALLDLTSWVKSTWTKDFATLEEELADICASIGVDIKEVYAYINTVVNTMNPGDQNDPDYKEFDVEEFIAELREMTVCDFVNGMMGEGAEAITPEQFAEMVDQAVGQFGTLKLVDVIEMIVSAQPQTKPNPPSYEEPDHSYDDGVIEEKPDHSYDDGGKGDAPKYSDDSESADPMRAQIVAIAEMLKSVSISFTTDKDGAFVSFSINVDIEDLLVGSSSESVGGGTVDEIIGGNGNVAIGGNVNKPVAAESSKTVIKLTASGALVVNTTGSVTADFTDTINSIMNKVNKVEFEEGDEIVAIDNGKYNYGEYVVVSYEGKLYLVSKFDVNNTGSYEPIGNFEPTELDGVACMKTICRMYTGDVISLDNLAGYMMQKHCSGYLYYSVVSFIGNYSAPYYTVYVGAEGVLKAEINKELTFSEDNKTSGEYSFEAIYSTVENKFYAYSDMHNYELTIDKKPVCCQGGVKTYTCKACGASYNEYYEGPDTVDKIVTLLTPGTTCNDGVKVEEKCNVCDKVFHSYTTTYHEMGERKIYIENGCGETYVFINSCACGYFNNSNTWDGSGFVHGDCRIEQVYGAYEDEGKEDAPVYTDGRYSVYKALYRCAVENCNVEYTFERYTIRDEANCVLRTYCNYTVNGTEYNFVRTEESHTYGEYEDLPNVQVGPYSVPHYKNYCATCGDLIEDYLYLDDKFGRNLVDYYFSDGYGNMRIFNSDCTYEQYRLDENLNYIRVDFDKENYFGEKQVQHANEWYWGYTHIEGSCTQVGRDERYCPACHLVETEAAALPEGHSYEYNGEIYVCTRCGVESNKGVDGNFIMEDFSNLEWYGNVNDMLKYGYFAAGFYNKSCYKTVTVYVLINYVDANNTGEWLEVDYERHYVNESFNDKYGYNTAYGKVVLDNESLVAAIQNRGITEINSISIVFNYYDTNDTYLNEILTIYTAE